MALERTILTAPTACPYCGCLLDRVTGLTTGGAPAPGDVSLCFRCANVLVLTSSAGAVRKPTFDELDAIMACPGAWSIRRAQHLLRKRQEGN